MSKFMKRLQKTQSDVTVSDRTSQFVNSHRNKYLHLSHAMKMFDKEDEYKYIICQKLQNIKTQ